MRRLSPIGMIPYTGTRRGGVVSAGVARRFQEDRHACSHLGDSLHEGFPDEPSDEMVKKSNAWSTGMVEIGERAQSLGCVDVGSLVCERQPVLDPKGDAGIRFIYDNTPCNLEGTFGPASEEETRYQAWQDAEVGEGDPSAPEGDGSDGSATTSVGLGATSCVELADLAVDVHRQVLDAMGGETFDGELPPEVVEALDRAQLLMSQLPVEVEACAGGFEEFDELRCDRVQELQTFGLEPIFLEDLFPPCPADGT